jgi:hypothetical protein
VTLHVTNGDSTAATLRETSLGGDVLPWRDALHEGPLGTREVRAQFLFTCGLGSYHGILSDLVARDYALAGARDVVLWFEHDLYDQLQLVEILARRPPQAELIQAAVFLGELAPPELEALWPTRMPVSAEQLDLAADVWADLVSDRTPLDRGLSALPFLEAALRRLAEDREDPPRSDRQLLEILSEGPRTRYELFQENAKREESVFAGDFWIWRRLDALVEQGVVVEEGENLRLAEPIDLQTP